MSKDAMTRLMEEEIVKPHLIKEERYEDTTPLPPRAVIQFTYEGSFQEFTAWMQSTFKSPNNLPINVQAGEKNSSLHRAALQFTFEGTSQEFIAWMQSTFKNPSPLRINVQAGDGIPLPPPVRPPTPTLAVPSAPLAASPEAQYSNQGRLAEDLKGLQTPQREQFLKFLNFVGNYYPGSREFKPDRVAELKDIFGMAATLMQNKTPSSNVKAFKIIAAESGKTLTEAKAWATENLPVPST